MYYHPDFYAMPWHVRKRLRSTNTTMGLSVCRCAHTGGVQTKGLESDSVAVAEARRSVMALLLHGDAAFAGQGVVAEMLQLANIPGEAADSCSTQGAGRGMLSCKCDTAISGQCDAAARGMPGSHLQEQQGSMLGTGTNGSYCSTFACACGHLNF